MEKEGGTTELLPHLVTIECFLIQHTFMLPFYSSAIYSLNTLANRSATFFLPFSLR